MTCQDSTSTDPTSACRPISSAAPSGLLTFISATTARESKARLSINVGLISPTSTPPISRTGTFTALLVLSAFPDLMTSLLGKKIAQGKYPLMSWATSMNWVVLERAAGIEPASLAWKARVLPLHNARKQRLARPPACHRQGTHCGRGAGEITREAARQTVSNLEINLRPSGYEADSPGRRFAFELRQCRQSRRCSGCRQSRRDLDLRRTIARRRLSQDPSILISGLDRANTASRQGAPSSF